MNSELSGDIFFVGDSFCASYDIDLWKSLGCNLWQGPMTKDNTPFRHTHPTIVSEHLNYRLHPHGYGGKSWWYSRNKFLNDFNISSKKPTFDLKCIIFFHTDCGRFNNSEHELSADTDRNYLKIFYKKYYDEEFYRWAQLQWFHELQRDFKNIKTIHFSCTPFLPGADQLLPGMVFNTPLIQISLGELTGSEKDILLLSSAKETRANHLNEENNRILAEIIIKSIQSYKPGTYELDLKSFCCPNKNARNWPASGFGTL